MEVDSSVVQQQEPLEAPVSALSSAPQAQCSVASVTCALSMEVDSSDWRRVVREIISVTNMMHILSTKLDSRDQMKKRASKTVSSLDVTMGEGEVQFVHKVGWSR